jgi:hypothetical protein
MPLKINPAVEDVEPDPQDRKDRNLNRVSEGFSVEPSASILELPDFFRAHARHRDPNLLAISWCQGNRGACNALGFGTFHQRVCHLHEHRNRSQPTSNAYYESLASSLYCVSSKCRTDLLRLDGGDAVTGRSLEDGNQTWMANVSRSTIGP